MLLKFEFVDAELLVKLARMREHLAMDGAAPRHSIFMGFLKNIRNETPFSLASSK